MKNILVAFLAFCLVLSSYSQDTYVRPSVSLINIDFKNSSSKLDLGSVNVPSSLDQLFMSKDRFSTSASAPKDDSNKKELEEISKVVLKDFVNKKISNASIMAVVPISNGEYNYDAVLQRGVNSATDQDVNLTSQSMVAEAGNEKDRYLYITEKMLNRNYVVALHQHGFYSYSDEYSQGFKGSISYVIFKINSIYANSDLTISANALPNANVNAEVVLIDRTIEMTASNLKGISNSSPLYKSEADLKNYLKELLFMQVWQKAVRKVPDFQPRTTLLAKRKMALGTKEAIEIDNRFFVYEYVQNRKGDVVKKKRATMRVKKVGDNKGKATGKSEKSKLYKIGYGRAKEGMFLQQKEDVGVGISAGFGEYSWLRVDGRLKGTWPGMLLFLDIHPFPGQVKFIDDKFQNYPGSSAQAIASSGLELGDFTAFAFSVYAGLERQVRLGSALYISPFLGGGYSMISLTGDVFEIPGTYSLGGMYTWDDDDSNIYSAVLATGGARLGLQLSSSLSANLTLGYLLPVYGGFKDPSFSLAGTGIDSYYNLGIDEEVKDQEVLQDYYEEVVEDMPTIPDGLQTTIMLRYEF